VRGVEEVLVHGVAVDRGDEAVFDADRVVQRLDDGGEAVRVVHEAFDTMLCFAPS
jgi:hypothetical protein